MDEADALNTDYQMLLNARLTLFLSSLLSYTVSPLPILNNCCDNTINSTMYCTQILCVCLSPFSIYLLLRIDFFLSLFFFSIYLAPLFLTSFSRHRLSPDKNAQP